MDLTAALAAGLAAPRPRATTWGLTDALGGRRPGTRALALARIGRPLDGELPRPGTEDYRRYRAARRTVERWQAYERPEAGSQRRKPNAAWLEGERGRIWAAVTHRRLAAMRRRGMRTRIHATVRVSDDVRHRQLPAGGPGLFLAARIVATIADPFEAGNFTLAAERYWAAFQAAYGGGEELGFELGDVQRVKAWADGEDEPR